MRLRITAADGEREVTLRGERAVLGRLPGCDVVIEAGGVSREHAELVCEGGAWWIADLGSRNGTFVNEQPVERRRLAPGDVVRLGPEVRVDLLDLGSADVEATRASAPHAARGRADAADDEPDEAPGAGPDTGVPHPGWFARLDWILAPRASHARPVTLTAAVTTVGRDPGAGLTLDDESVSRMHARLDRDGGSLFVTDLKSRNGTFVNAEPVLRAPLHPGDALRFGDVEYKVGRRVGPAWNRIAALAGGALLVALAVVAAFRVSDSLNESAQVERVAKRVRTQALADTRAGIEASREGDAEMARAHLLYAADLLLLSDLAPRGATLADPAGIFHEIVPLLPEDAREFDFARALDPQAIEASQARLASLTNREYVEHQLRRYAVELGQDPNVPGGFVDAVWGFVNEYEKYPGSMQVMLRRARDLQPRIRAILANRHLPEAFCYVAWVESGLDPMQESHVGALGLWQLMPATAAQYKLRVTPGDKAHDDRTDVERSTAAAADYFASLLRAQGPEYFMLVLASYNRGPQALERAKQKVEDPMLPAPRKYWYLVEHDLLPEETRNYVPRIFAVRLIAEAPERFGFEARP